MAGLGPEPLEAGFDGAYLAGKLAGKLTSVKAALLDQRIVAGLGNIYVCEALYRARLSPRRLAGTIGRGRAERLVAAIRAVLGEAIEAGGSSLRDYVQADGELGYFQHRWAVYGREGEPCPGLRLRRRGAPHRPVRPLDILLRKEAALIVHVCGLKIRYGCFQTRKPEGIGFNLPIHPSHTSWTEGSLRS